MKTSKLVMFGEVFAVYFQIHMEQVNTVNGQNAQTFSGKQYDPYIFTWLWKVKTHLIFLFRTTPTNAQLFHKLSHPYMFRHCRVILRELVINNLPSYTSISDAAVGNTVCN